MLGPKKNLGPKKTLGSKKKSFGSGLIFGLKKYWWKKLLAEKFWLENILFQNYLGDGKNSKYIGAWFKKSNLGLKKCTFEKILA